jgi:MtrB/PioB family decaheme-associated outer membrane protein
MKTAPLLLPGLLAAIAAHAQEPAGGLRVPESWISVGAGTVTGDERERTLFGQYNGLREQRGNLLLDADVVKRDEATGLWTTLRARDLGLETPELGLTVQRQGDWRVNADYAQIAHHEIRTLNSGMLNAGTPHPSVRVIAPGMGDNLNFQLQRNVLGLSGDKWFRPGLQFEVAFRNEDKDGTRLWGRGYDCAAYVCATTQNAVNTRWAVLMVPEPVNSNTKQLDAKLNFVGEKLFLSAGYYGSFYTNAYGNVQPTVPNQLYGPLGAAGGLRTLDPAAAGGTSLQNVLQLPMALYPDNQAHQVYLSGNYAFRPALRSTFKLAYTHATQDADFAAMGFTGAPTVLRPNLGGVVDTTLAQLGLSARPAPRLSLLANVRYEQKDDRTPIELYNVENTVRWENSHASLRRLTGKLEASYLLPANVRATLGGDYERIDHALPDPVRVQVAGMSGLRGRTDEYTMRGELRRSLSETLTGSLGASHSERYGSNWYNLCTSAACATQGLSYGGAYPYAQIYQTTGTFPFNVADRKRDALKVTADWLPLETLSLQLVAQAAHDGYDPPSMNGLRQGALHLVSADLAYTPSERWKLSAYGSVSDQTMNEADRTNYIADTRNRSVAYGLSAVAHPSGVLEVGAGVTRVLDITKYQLSADQATTPNNVLQASIGLPDVGFSEIRYGAYTKYAVTKQADLRFELTRIVSRLDEWSWGYGGVPFVYSDGTTVTLTPRQQVTFAAARFIYKF